MNYLTTSKALLGITDDTKDDILNIIIDDVINMILGYCRIDQIPTKLETCVPIMAKAYYEITNAGNMGAGEFVKSETQGKRSYTVQSAFDIDSFLTDYKERLNPFRNWRGRVPTDLDEAVTD